VALAWDVHKEAPFGEPKRHKTSLVDVQKDVSSRSAKVGRNSLG
jgi:hypothetical protein